LAWPAIKKAVIIPLKTLVRQKSDRKLQRRFEDGIIMNGHRQFLYEFAPNGFSNHLTGRLELKTYDIAVAYENSVAKNLEGFPEFEVLRFKYEQRIEELNARTSKFWNGSQIAPYNVTRRRTKELEKPEVHIEFINKNYASHVIGETLEELSRREGAGEYFRGSIMQPDSLLATDFGLIINVVSADNKAIVARRSEEAYSWNGYWHVAVAESINQQDPENDGTINFLSVVKRALREELGIELDDSSIKQMVKIHTVNIHLQRHSWMLLINVNLRNSDFTFRKIQALRTVIGKDKWESSDLRPVDFEEESLLNELKNEDKWIPFGLMCLMLSAIADNIMSVDAFLRVLKAPSTSTNR
jgi:hypothetical protein